ncbi:hypothetical protein [Micromonospora sp. CA-244673]|uniref:hypothetical protein n=1 Tax=Micromonospora sp. CA-244673 TaxID=3239958 RepID=UPI003D8F8A2F
MSERGATEREPDPTGGRPARQGGEQSEPDVLLDIPEVTVDQIRLTVRELDADLSLRARLANLLQLDAGVRVHLDDVELDVTGVSAEVLLKVRLEKLVQILDRALSTIDRNPHLIEALARSAASGDDENRAAHQLASAPVLDERGQRIGTVGAVADRALRESLGQPAPPSAATPSGARAPEPPTGDQGLAKPPTGGQGQQKPPAGGGGGQPSGGGGGGARAGASRESGPPSGQGGPSREGGQGGGPSRQGDGPSRQGGGPSREGWQPGREGGPSREGGQSRQGGQTGGQGGPSGKGAGQPSTGPAKAPGAGAGERTEPGKPAGKPDEAEKGKGGPPGPAQLAGQAGETLLQAGRSVWEAIQSGMSQHRPKR